jgi:hypothetical protein
MEDERKQFIENIQKWVAIDSQLKTIHEKVKKARETKNQLMANIYDYVEKKSLGNTKIEISDGELRFCDKREYQPISFGYVEECLEALLKDPKQVETIMDYLHDHREVKISKDIRRHYTQSHV